MYKNLLTQQLRDQFLQSWFSDMTKSSRGGFYSSFKKEFELEKYLLRIPSHLRIWLTKLRTSNLKLPVETGRWNGIQYELRTCNFCHRNVGNEYHVLFECKNDLLISLRNKLIPVYFTRNPNVHKMYGMLSNCHTELLKNVSIFIKKLNMLL